MPADHFEHTTGLIDVLVHPTATLDEARTLVRDTVTRVLDGRDDDPMVTVYVDRPTSEPEATRHDVELAISALGSEFDITFFQVHVDDRPLLGHPLADADTVTEPLVVAAKRACCRVASALMHAHDLDRETRLQAAVNCTAAVHQVNDIAALDFAAQQLGEVGWQLGDHPIVRAAEAFAGKGEASELTADNLLERCVALAEALSPGDGAVERAMQQHDERVKNKAFPAVPETPTTTDQLLGVVSGLAARVESAFLVQAEHGLENYTDDLFVPRESEPLQYIGNIGDRLRATVSELERDHHAYNAAHRVSLAHDSLTLLTMVSGPTLGSDPQVTAMLFAALELMVRESTIAHGMMDEHTTTAMPLDLPYWPFILHRAGASETTVDLTVLDTLVEHATRLASTGDVPSDLLDLVAGWRAHLSELKGNPAAADKASLAEGLIDAILLKLAVRAGEEDTSRYMELARTGGLATDPGAVAAVKRFATGGSDTDGSSAASEPAEASDAARTAVSLAATVLGNQLAYLRDEGSAGMPGTLTLKDGTIQMGYLAAENSEHALQMFTAGLGKGEEAAAAGVDTYLRMIPENTRYDAIMAVGATPEGICVRIAVPYVAQGGTVTFPRPAQIVEVSAGLTIRAVCDIVAPKLTEFDITKVEAVATDAANKASSAEDDLMSALFGDLLNRAASMGNADLSMCDPEDVEAARGGAMAAFLQVAGSDGNVDEAEVKVFFGAMSQSAHTLNQTLFPMDPDGMQQTLASMPRHRDRLLCLKALGSVYAAHPEGGKAKVALVEALKLTALADGTVDQREIDALSKLDDMFSGKAVEDWDRTVKRFWLFVGVVLLLGVGCIIGCGAWLFS